jgi:hypothetical protein
MTGAAGFRVWRHGLPGWSLGLNFCVLQQGSIDVKSSSRNLIAPHHKASTPTVALSLNPRRRLCGRVLRPALQQGRVGRCAP